MKNKSVSFSDIVTIYPIPNRFNPNFYHSKILSKSNDPFCIKNVYTLSYLNDYNHNNQYNHDYNSSYDNHKINNIYNINSYCPIYYYNLYPYCNCNNIF